MADWVNRSLSQQAAGSGTTTATFTFTAATANNLLVAVVYGAVTFTTPTGWTLVNSAVNNGGLYVFSKTATGGETTFSSTNNAASYASVAVVYEFPSGSSVASSAAAINASSVSAFTGAALTGLTGAHGLMAVGAEIERSGDSLAESWGSWSSGAVADTNVAVLHDGTAATDGYGLGVGYLSGSSLTSWTPTATITNPTGATAEAITLAVTVAAGVQAFRSPLLYNNRVATMRAVTY